MSEVLPKTQGYTFISQERRKWTAGWCSVTTGFGYRTKRNAATPYHLPAALLDVGPRHDDKIKDMEYRLVDVQHRLLPREVVA